MYVALNLTLSINHCILAIQAIVNNSEWGAGDGIVSASITKNIYITIN